MVDVDARPAVLLARIKFLLDHDRVDEMQPFRRSGWIGVATITSAPSRITTSPTGACGRGFDLISESKLEKAGPYVTLSRQEYRRALTLAPYDWDAKFNLDVASRLIRDFPAFERTIGDTLEGRPQEDLDRRARQAGGPAVIAGHPIPSLPGAGQSARAAHAAAAGARSPAR